MAIVYEGASNNYLNKLEKANLFFTFSFVLEAILKLISYGKIFSNIFLNKLILNKY